MTDTDAAPIPNWLKIHGFDADAPEPDHAEQQVRPPRLPLPHQPYRRPWKLPYGRPSNPLLPRD
jgi:hypothetical protein